MSQIWVKSWEDSRDKKARRYYAEAKIGLTNNENVKGEKIMGVRSIKKQAGRALPAKEAKKTIIEGICAGESLRKICKAPGMPNRATVHRWLLSDTDFCDQYARAREIQAEEIFPL